MEQRPLGDYERYSLARHNVGHAPAVVFTAQLASDSDSLSPRALVTAIHTLLTREPLLSSSIPDPTAETPHYRLERDLDPADVLVELDRIGHAGADDDALLDGLRAINDLDLTCAPLWRVFLYRSDPATKRTRIAVATHHTLCDGTASRNLFVEILTLLRTTPSPPSAESVARPFPPSLEATVDVKVSKFLLLQTFLSSLVTPYLPSFLCTPLTPCWPNPAVVPPLGRPTALESFFLSAELSLALSTVAKSHSVKTLHPVLVTAAAMAIANVVSRRDPDRSSPLVVSSQSPVSLRSSDLGHTSSVTGNYISSVAHALPAVTPEYLASTSFWSETRAYAEHSRRPATLDRATKGMGMLAFLPASTARDREQGRTGWERYLEDAMARDANPWKGGSFEVSNLGRLPDFGPEWERHGRVEGVCWAQPASGTGPGLSFNTVSSGGVLACTVSWRKDSIHAETVEEIVEAFRKILVKIAQGKVAENTSVGDLS
ncbi:hypothetical protein JCM11491_002528 [Sporobolomyces phaffii]